MYKLTNKNIRLRYLVEIADTAARQLAGENIPRFTYAVMAKIFLVTRQRCYEWCKIPREGEKADLPTGPRRAAVYLWLNDGAMEAYFKEKP